MSILKRIILKLILSVVITIALIYLNFDSFLDTFGGNGVLYTILAAIGSTILMTGIVYSVLTLLWLCWSYKFKYYFDSEHPTLLGFFVMAFITRIIPISVWLFAGYFFVEWLGPDYGLFDGILCFVYFSLFLWIDLVKLYKE